MQLWTYLRLLNTFDLVVIACYLVALVVIGFATGKKGIVPSDLFLGGRNLSWPGIGFSIFSSNVTPVMLVSFAGLAYSTGIVGSNFEWLGLAFSGPPVAAVCALLSQEQH